MPRPGRTRRLWPVAVYRPLRSPIIWRWLDITGPALSARGMNAELKMHTYELAGWQFDARGWLLRAIPYTDPELMHPEDLCWPIRHQQLPHSVHRRLRHHPGSRTRSLCRVGEHHVRIASRDPAIASLNIQGVSTTTYNPNLWGGPGHRLPPPQIAMLLAPYRRYSIGTGQG